MLFSNQIGKGGNRTFARLATDGDLRDHQREAEGNGENDIDKQEHAAAVLRSQIREAPDVAKTDSRACRGKDKSEFSCE